MNKNEINEIYNNVIYGRQHFSVLYNSLTPIRNKFITNTQKLHIHDLLEIFDDTVIKLVKKAEQTKNFVHLLNMSLKNTRIDYHRNRKRIKEREQLTEYLDETAATVNDVENSVIKKETDHRQVIDFLLRHSPYDSDTTAIVNEFLQDETGCISPGRVAAKLNLHPETVKRKLHRLARYYDASRFGNVQEYFAV